MKKLSIILLFIAAAITVSAQLPQEFGRFKRAAKIHQSTPEHEMISKIAKDGAFIFSQSYQLEDSVGKFFGLSGNREFGSENTLAIKVKNGYLIYDIARVPWDYNPRFAKFKKRYTPVLFPSQYSELNTEARYDSISYKNEELVTIYPEQLYGMKSDIFFNDGFSVAHRIGNSDGFVVWYILPSDMDMNATTNLDIVVVPEKIEISEDRSKEYPVSYPQVDGTIMGGLYIVPEISSVGRLDFIINGILIGSQDDWKLVCPFANTDNVFSSTTNIPVKAEEEIDVELTPNEITK